VLILNRQTGQSIKIGEDIVIQVLSVRGGQVRIGIDAPKDVRVVRDNAKVKDPK